jgi:hypothetical protein
MSFLKLPAFFPMPTARSQTAFGRLRVRLLVEALEDRTVPTPLLVANLADSGAGSLRAAVLAANIDARSKVSDTISFAPSLSGDTIALSSGPLELGQGGAGTGTITINGGGSITISGGGISRVLQVDVGTHAVLNGLTIEDGNADANSNGGNVGGGVENLGTLAIVNCVVTGNSASNFGGGIDNNAALSVSNSTISQNSSGGGGGGIHNYGNTASLKITGSNIWGNTATGDGGGIVSTGALTVAGTTVDDNSAGGFAGGIGSSGTATITNSSVFGNTAVEEAGGVGNAGSATITASTISGNSATGSSGEGGGVGNAGVLSITNSTIAGNSANTGGGIGSSGTITVTSCTVADNSAQNGGGIGGDNHLTLFNTIIAGNSAAVAGPDLGASGINSTSGHNLIGNGSGNNLVNGVNGNIVGKPAVLSSLGNYGGPTQSIVPLPGSPAHGAGMAAVGVTTDQRGFARPVSKPDIGAFQSEASIVVNTAADPRSVTSSSSPGNIEQYGKISLREAINLADTVNVSAVAIGETASSPTITFAPALNGSTITLIQGGLELTAGTGTTTIKGGGEITVSGDGKYGVFQVDAGAQAVLTGLAIDDGNTSSNGGGIYNNGLLSIANCTIADNSASQDGGGILNDEHGSLSITNSTIAGNSAGQRAGGIGSGGSLSITDCTIADNSSSLLGGGIGSAGPLFVTNCTIAGNSAGQGGGIGTLVVPNALNPETANVTDTTIADNSAADGGGIYIDPAGALTLQNTIVAGNTAGANADIDGSAAGSNNLVGDGTGLTGITAGDGDHNQVGPGGSPIKPLLSPLGNYGGPTQTIALLPGSPAIGAGVAIPVIMADERGIKHPATAPDIGAFQSRGFTVTVVAGDSPQTTVISTTFAKPLGVIVKANAVGEPVNGGVITYVVPSNSNQANAALSSITAPIVSGKASVTALANNVTGTYQIGAGAAGVATLARFALTNKLPPVPKILPINPTGGPALGGTTVTITGTNLGSASTATVKFGSIVAAIVSDNGSTLVVTTPAEAAGTVNVTVTTPGGTSAAQKFLYVAGTVAAPTVTDLTQTAWTVNQPGFTNTLTIDNGTAPFTIVGAALPVGLTAALKNATEIIITGTPKVAGSFANESVTIEDASGIRYTKVFASPIVINKPIAFLRSSLPAFTVGTFYSQTVTVSGGTGADTFAVTSGQLPDHLTLDPGTGEISGTPDASASATFTVTVTDAIGATAKKTYVLVAI